MYIEYISVVITLYIVGMSFFVVFYLAFALKRYKLSRLFTQVTPTKNRTVNFLPNPDHHPSFIIHAYYDISFRVFRIVVS